MSATYTATVAQSASVQGDPSVSSFTVSDSAANVQAWLAALLLDSKLTSITITDAGVPTLTLSIASYLSDLSVLEKINTINSGTGNISYTITIADTAANIEANLSNATSEILPTLSSIILTDASTPTIILTPSECLANSTVLSKITTPYNLTLKPAATVDQAITLKTASLGNVTLSLSVSDTAARVEFGLPSLHAYSALTSIFLTDPATPTIALTPSAYSSDTDVLSKIGSPYNLDVTSSPPPLVVNPTTTQFV